MNGGAAQQKKSASPSNMLHTIVAASMQTEISFKNNPKLCLRVSTQGPAESQESISLVASSQQALLGSRVSLGSRPAGEHESDLVDKVCDVVDHIEEGLIHLSEQVAEEIASWVDGPANCDNHAHVVEGGRNSFAALTNAATCFTSEDFEKNKGPASQTSTEGRPSREDAFGRCQDNLCIYHDRL